MAATLATSPQTPSTSLHQSGFCPVQVVDHEHDRCLLAAMSASSFWNAQAVSSGGPGAPSEPGHRRHPCSGSSSSASAAPSRARGGEHGLGPRPLALGSCQAGGLPGRSPRSASRSRRRRRTDSVHGVTVGTIGDPVHELARDPGLPQPGRRRTITPVGRRAQAMARSNDLLEHDQVPARPTIGESRCRCSSGGVRWTSSSSTRPAGAAPCPSAANGSTGSAETASRHQSIAAVSPSEACRRGRRAARAAPRR